MESQPGIRSADLYKHAAKLGGILGAAMILVISLLYVTDIGLMASLTFITFTILSYVGYGIYAGISYRRVIGGYISYGKAYVHGFATLVVAGLLTSVFNILLYTIIDPSLPAALVESIIINTEESMRNWQASESTIEETIARMRQDLPKNFTTVGLVLGYCKGLITYAIIALVTSLVVRRNEPMEI